MTLSVSCNVFILFVAVAVFYFTVLLADAFSDAFCTNPHPALIFSPCIIYEAKEVNLCPVFSKHLGCSTLQQNETALKTGRRILLLKARIRERSE